jgi:hypothetical protein
VFYGNTRRDAAAAGFDDEFIYSEMPLPPERRKIAMTPMLRDEAQAGLNAWLRKADRVNY